LAPEVPIESSLLAPSPLAVDVAISFQALLGGLFLFAGLSRSQSLIVSCQPFFLVAAGYFWLAWGLGTRRQWVMPYWIGFTVATTAWFVLSPHLLQALLQVTAHRPARNHGSDLSPYMLLIIVVAVSTPCEVALIKLVRHSQRRGVHEIPAWKARWSLRTMLVIYTIVPALLVADSWRARQTLAWQRSGVYQRPHSGAGQTGASSFKQRPSGASEQ
jgi:hypothetical protein